MTKHPTLFGRKMRKVSAGHYELAGFQILDCSSMDGPAWFGWCFGDRSPPRTDPQSAARALERKIVAAHRRLAKLIGTSQAEVVFVDRGISPIPEAP